jgi:ribonuclease HI
MIKNDLSIYCDGGARGNPGPAAIAFVVWQDNKIIYRFSRKIGKTTNNVAEYQAVIAALDWLKDQFSVISLQSSVTFYLDSLLIVNQLNGIFKIKNSFLKELIFKIKNLEKKLKVKIDYHHITRSKNKIADALVNQALNSL